MRRGENLLRRGDRWFFRCRVPSDLIDAMGRREVVLSLRTGDRDMARFLAAAIRPRVGRWWLEAVTVVGSGKEQHVLVELLHKRFASDLDAAFRHYVEASAKPDYVAELNIAAAENAFDVATIDANDRALTFWIDAAAAMLSDLGYVAGPTDQRTRVLARHLIDTASQIADARSRWHRGDEAFRPRFPSLPPDLFPAPKTRQQRRNEEKKSEPPENKHVPVPVMELVEGWARENDKERKQLYEARRIVRTMIEVVGKDDAALISPADAVRWKEQRMVKLATYTIRREVSQCSCVWKWAKANHKLPVGIGNPFEGIAPKKPRGGTASPVRPFTEAEAEMILLAARQEKKPWLRWLPWIAAYTGARLGEIVHAKKEDVRVVRDVPVLDVHTNREQPLKTAWSMRMIPLHRDLIAEGFLDYVASLPAGAVLFPGVKQDVHGDRAGIATKLVGYWVRKKLNLIDDRISPSHSWRHLFADRRRSAGMSVEMGDAIEGHELKGSSGKGYGDGYRGKPWETVAAVQRMSSLAPRRDETAIEPPL